MAVVGDGAAAAGAGASSAPDAGLGVGARSLDDGLGAGASVSGPAIIEEVTTTIVIEPGWTATLDASGSYVITHKKR